VPCFEKASSCGWVLFQKRQVPAARFGSFVLCVYETGAHHRLVCIHIKATSPGVALRLVSFMSEGWNVVQVTGALMTIASCLSFLARLRNLNEVAGVTAFLVWIQVLYFLRAFEFTGALVRMIFKVCGRSIFLFVDFLAYLYMGFSILRCFFWLCRICQLCLWC
jgi:hypothetical protein